MYLCLVLILVLCRLTWHWMKWRVYRRKVQHLRMYLLFSSLSNVHMRMDSRFAIISCFTFLKDERMRGSNIRVFNLNQEDFSLGVWFSHRLFYRQNQLLYVTWSAYLEVVFELACQNVFDPKWTKIVNSLFKSLSIHQKLTEHGRYCMQENQLPIKSPVHLNDYSIASHIFILVGSWFHCQAPSWRGWYMYTATTAHVKDLLVMRDGYLNSTGRSLLRVL